MSLALYMDVHVPAAITHGLRERGVDVLSAQEDGRSELDDADLLDRATSIGRALFSQDSDLIAEAGRRQRSDIPFAGVIYAPQQALSIRQFIEELETIAKAGELHDTANRVTYLPLR